jgi:putative transposase
VSPAESRSHEKDQAEPDRESTDVRNGSRGKTVLSDAAGEGRIKRHIKPIHAAVNADAGLAALDDLDEKWRSKYRAMIRLRRNAWNEVIPFLDYDVEIRRVICSTNAVESLNARYRRAVRARHFPSEQAALDLAATGC